MDQIEENSVIAAGAARKPFSFEDHHLMRKPVRSVNHAIDASLGNNSTGLKWMGVGTQTFLGRIRNGRVRRCCMESTMPGRFRSVVRRTLQ
jgi:hypothetical protein